MSGPRSGGAGTPPTGTGSPPRVPAAPSGRAVPVTVRPHGIRQRRCGSAGRRVAGTTTTEPRRPCCARSGSCGSTGQACLTSAPHGGPEWTARTRGFGSSAVGVGGSGCGDGARAFGAPGLGGGVFRTSGARRELLRLLSAGVQARARRTPVHTISLLPSSVKNSMNVQDPSAALICPRRTGC